MRVPEVRRRSLKQRCRHTRGDWCGRYERLPELPAKPPPRGDKECVANCNGVGVCDHDTGVCECPAGWTGPDCRTPLRRPCARRYRIIYDESPEAFIPIPGEPIISIDADGRDKDWTVEGWTAARCPGICDDEIAACFCDNPTFGFLPAPPGSPPGTPPLRRGRALADHCDPKTTYDGRKVPWGNIAYDKVYGKDGWCNATHPTHSCGCILDGFFGDMCERVHEMYCTNQCSGHGTCYLGFCKCYPGWYGHDCARKRAGLEMEPGDAEPTGRSPWLRPVVAEAPAARALPPGATRKRPFIYVYELPSEFHSRMLQYRILRNTCIHRRFNDQNKTRAVTTNLYGVETLLHELMLQSAHRTFDPEEADFFYVPVMTTCLMYPVFAWTDGPWYNAPLHLRTMQASNFLLKAKRWLQDTHPYWNRSAGRDHIWLALHDEGACWMPSEIYNTSIMLTHWGRMDRNHTSNTAYGWDNYDNYDKYLTHPLYEPGDWRLKHRGHACYSPSKDLVIPSIKHADQYRDSPLLGAPQPQRDILLFFKGDVGLHRLKHYSRGIRQKLHKLATTENWAGKYNIRIGATHEEHVAGTYSAQLARSQFCLVAPGDGWSGRAEDAVLHGCIPVVVMDDVHAVFESILDWDSFSVRVREASLAHLPQILMAIPQDVRDRMQQRITRIWHRFAWSSGPYMRSTLRPILADRRPQGAPSPRRRIMNFQDDAFQTIIQWLAGRMEN